MFITRQVLASSVRVPPPHKPLIKFLGPRHLLYAKKTSHLNEKSPNSRDQIKAPEVDKYGTKIYFIKEDELPGRFKRVPPAEIEAECIMLGGAL